MTPMGWLGRKTSTQTRYPFNSFLFLHVNICCGYSLRGASKEYQNICFNGEIKQIQSTLIISNSKGLYEILRGIRTSTYQICRIDEKLIRLTTFNKYMCNWTLEVRDILKILWKRGEIAPLFHNIFLHVLRFSCLEGTRFSLRDKRLFEISEFEIAWVNCISIFQLRRCRMWS